MSVQVEKLDNNMVKLTIEIPADKVEEAIKKAYHKQKGKIAIHGFRKGKVPQHIIEKMYGAEVFYEEASDILIEDSYSDSLDECGEEIVSRPSIEIVQIEKGKPFIYTAEAAKRPDVKLGKYKGVTVTKVDTTVTDAEVDEAVESERNRNGRSITDENRIIENGDTAVIDFEGFLDGAPFEGGKGEKHPLEIGSGSFIPGFEEQLIGKKAGDEVDVNVTFPEDYHAEDLAGKAVVFKVKIHEVRYKELPELNDEFAQDVSEFDTLSEYKEEVKKNLTKNKEDEAKRKKEDEAIEKIIEDSEMDIPGPMIETQIDSMMREFAQRMQMQGLNVQQYMQYTGQTVDMMRDQMREEAENRIKSSLVLEQIVKDEGIEISDEEVEGKIREMAENYKMEVDELKKMYDDARTDTLKRELSIEKAIDVILDNVKETAAKKTSKKKTDKAAEEKAEEKAKEEA